MFSVEQSQRLSSSRWNFAWNLNLFYVQITIKENQIPLAFCLELIMTRPKQPKNSQPSTSRQADNDADVIDDLRLDELSLYADDDVPDPLTASTASSSSQRRYVVSTGNRPTSKQTSRSQSQPLIQRQKSARRPRPWIIVLVLLTLIGGGLWFFRVVWVSYYGHLAEDAGRR